MNAIATRATHEYLTRVRTSLADIPGAEVDDLLDDVRPHLADIAAEIGPDCTLRDMIARLGTPEQYAAELRSAGDYPPAPSGPVASQTRRPRLALWSMLIASFALMWFAVIAIVDGAVEALFVGILLCGTVIGFSAVSVVRRGTDAFEELPEIVWLRESYDSPTGRYLKSLAPGWWIGAAFIFVGAALFLARHSDAAIALPIFATCAGLIIFAGRRVGTNGAWMWATVPLSAIAIGSVLGVPEAMTDARTDYGQPAVLMPGLNGDVTNIYGFTPDGKPISDFYLVDQDGHPINVNGMKCGPSGPEFAGTDNHFPKSTVTDDSQCKESRDTPFTVAIPQSSAPATTSATATTPAPTTTVEPAPAP
ncbi:MAG: hypothetical protein LLG14_23835 [Nocardiaceae bacterium]|nr:hypothetical protein [Nocardiaceae bacterium]